MASPAEHSASGILFFGRVILLNADLRYLLLNGENEEQHRLRGSCTCLHLCLSHLLHPFCGLRL